MVNLRDPETGNMNDCSGALWSVWTGTSALSCDMNYNWMHQLSCTWAAAAARRCRIYWAHAVSPKCFRYVKVNSSTRVLCINPGFEMSSLGPDRYNLVSESPSHMWRISNLSRPGLKGAGQADQAEGSPGFCSRGQVQQNHHKETLTKTTQAKGWLKAHEIRAWGSGHSTWSTIHLQKLHGGCVTNLPTARRSTCTQRHAPQGLTSAAVPDCVILLPGSALPPCPSHKNAPSHFILLSFSHKCLSRVLSRCYRFLSGKIRRSIHTLAFRKEKLAFLFSFIKHIFPLCLGTSRQALVIKVQSIPKCNWNQWSSNKVSLSRFLRQQYHI